MINFLIGKIIDFCTAATATGGTLEGFKGVDYGSDLNNIKALPAVRFFLSDFNADRLDAAEISFDFLFLASGLGDTVLQRRQAANALLWDGTGAQDRGVLPFLRSFRGFLAKDARGRAWAAARYTNPELLIGNRGQAAQYAIGIRITFAARWPYI